MNEIANMQQYKTMESSKSKTSLGIPGGSSGSKTSESKHVEEKFYREKKVSVTVVWKLYMDRERKREREIDRKIER